MLYLNTQHIKQIGVDWHGTVQVIQNAVLNLKEQNFAQPIKPYLRFKDKTNRIIAMPAYIGGDFEAAGIKWIASFPKNIDQGIQRAHSVTILNDSDTGKPFATLNTAIVSGIRTASVSGLIIQEFEKVRDLKDVKVGIIGFGPIGQLHLSMVTNLLGDKIASVTLYDKKGVNQEHIPAEILSKTNIVDSYEEAYQDTDIFITCTVAAEGYIDQKPKDGALLLNVSLRDFKPQILDYTKSIIVDDWEEVCRENTDIEVMHHERNLQKEDTYSIVDVVCHDAMNKLPAEQAVLFNPMGMAIFDVAIATYYYKLAMETGSGVQLDD
ncbi:2,3-diaminopropionate biosynthesis protein SbnB [Baia soyae]|uniref:Ornithine cyclodeaminase n=1 Tax=Baia soyae TaxID=1544746 RepID=A0A4R2RSR8_9BACL|nr:2,3-diaminopropionate biosynthesis protein SbnB [Baia soyae]TCP67310.1 ornithine cyclodeaminase [Baia soyae]